MNLIPCLYHRFSPKEEAESETIFRNHLSNNRVGDFHLK